MNFCFRTVIEVKMKIATCTEFHSRYICESVPVQVLIKKKKIVSQPTVCNKGNYVGIFYPPKVQGHIRYYEYSL